MFNNKLNQKFDIAVVGGAGHIGLPLSILLANSGYKVLIYDINKPLIESICSGIVPFMEEEAEPLLHKALQEENLALTFEPANLKNIPTIISTIGTPVDEFHNPITRLISEMIDELIGGLSEGQTLILRSTVSPGTTEWVDHYLQKKGKKLHVAFCPERVVQGMALKEIQKLPQIVSGITKQAEDNAANIFEKICGEIVRMKPMEAEFAKLFSNAYRYIQFAATNQFMMLTTLAGIDYSVVQKGMCHNYNRMRDLPSPGFAAGPCLFKDTMQLAAFSNNNFSIGYDAMRINEGLPLFLVSLLKQKFKLSETAVGLLGMSFKSDSDDVRSSLSYKLKKILRDHALEVFTTDPHVDTDTDLIPLEDVILKSDILILCAPHSAYKHIDLKGKPVVDVWSFFPPENRLPFFKLNN